MPGPVGTTLPSPPSTAARTCNSPVSDAAQSRQGPFSTGHSLGKPDPWLPQLVAGCSGASLLKPGCVRVRCQARPRSVSSCGARPALARLASVQAGRRWPSPTSRAWRGGQGPTRQGHPTASPRAPSPDGRGLGHQGREPAEGRSLESPHSGAGGGQGSHLLLSHHHHRGIRSICHDIITKGGSPQDDIAMTTSPCQLPPQLP